VAGRQRRASRNSRRRGRVGTVVSGNYGESGSLGDELDEDTWVRAYDCCGGVFYLIFDANLGSGECMVGIRRLDGGASLRALANCA
jgi:hypothetical protein